MIEWYLKALIACKLLFFHINSIALRESLKYERITWNLPKYVVRNTKVKKLKNTVAVNNSVVISIDVIAACLLPIRVTYVLTTLPVHDI